MYYPTLQDYMNMTHGKSFKLQQISVKRANHRICTSSAARTTTTPPSNHHGSGSEFTDSLTYTGQSDRSNSQSPPPGPLTSSLDVSYNSTASGLSSVRISAPHPPDRDHHGYRYGSHELEQSREFRSPLSPGGMDGFGGSPDRFEELGSYAGPPSHAGGMMNGRGHTRNGSFDDNTMLKQLRSGGQFCQ